MQACNALSCGRFPLLVQVYIRVRCNGGAGAAVGLEPIPLSVGGRYCGGAVVLAAKTLTDTDCSGRVVLKTKHVKNNLSWFAQQYGCAPSLTGVHMHLGLPCMAGGRCMHSVRGSCFSV